MRNPRLRKPETPFTREMRQLTSFLECYKEKSNILSDSPNLNHINQIFLESEFNYDINTPSYNQTNPNSNLNYQNSSKPGIHDSKNKPNQYSNNVHNMNRDPKSILEMLKNGKEKNGTSFPGSLEYSETEKIPSQKISNLWKNSHMEDSNSQKYSGISQINRNTSHNLDRLFEKNNAHLMGHKKNEFLDRINYLNKEAQEDEVIDVKSSKNVFINSDHLQMQKMNLMDQLSDIQSKKHSARPSQYSQYQPENLHKEPMQIKQAESFYDVETGNK